MATDVQKEIEALLEQEKFEEALPKLQALAEAGDLYALNTLGTLYFNGDGVEQDTKKGIELTFKAAEQGYADAQTAMGDFFNFGAIEDENGADKAIEWYEKAADQGDTHAMIMIAYVYDYEKNEPDQALEWYKKAAEAGDAEAREILGSKYLTGDDVEIDEAKALGLYLQSAEQGYPSAQADLGDLYYLGGADLEINVQKAMEWYMKAAEKGDSYAQSRVGDLYHYDEEFGPDPAKAVEWYTKAAEQGEDDAQKALGLMYFNGDGIPMDKEKAVEWLKKAAEQDNTDAMNTLGDYCCLTLADAKKGMEWYLKSAELDDPYAQSRIGALYHYDEEFGPDPAKAVEWYTRAAEQGEEDAQKALGDMYYCGDGVDEDKAEGAKWLEKAAAQGNPDAMKTLGDYSFLVLADAKKSMEWYKKAANADKSDTYPLTRIADIYRFDEELGPDLKKAAEYYKLAGLKGDEDALKQLKDLPAEENPSDKSVWEEYSDEILEEICENGLPYLLNDVARKFYAKGQYKRALKTFELAASYEDPEAMYELAKLYYDDPHVEKDLIKSYKWLCRANDLCTDPDIDVQVPEEWDYNGKIPAEIYSKRGEDDEEE